MENQFKHVCISLINNKTSEIRQNLQEYKDMLSSMPIFGQRQEKKELTNILYKQGDIKENIKSSKILGKIKKWKCLIDELQKQENKELETLKQKENEELEALKTKLEAGYNELDVQKLKLKMRKEDLEKDTKSDSKKKENTTKLLESQIKTKIGMMKYFDILINQVKAYMKNKDEKINSKIRDGLATLLHFKLMTKEDLPDQYKNIEPALKKI